MSYDQQDLINSTLSDDECYSPSPSILIYSDSESETESQVDDSAKVASHVLEAERTRTSEFCLSSPFFRRALATSSNLKKELYHKKESNNEKSTLRHDSFLPNSETAEPVLNPVKAISFRLDQHAWDRGQVKDEQLVNIFKETLAKSKGKGKGFPPGFLGRIMEGEKVTSKTTGGLDPVDLLKEINKQKKEKSDVQRRDIKSALGR